MATDWAKLARQTPSSSSFGGSNNNQGVLTQAYEETPVSKIPLLGGVIGSVLPGVETVAEGIAGSGDPNNPRFISKNEARALGPDKSFGDVTKTGAGIGLQTGLGVDALSGASALPKIIKSAPDAVGWLRNGNPQNITNAATAATKGGAADSLANIVTEFQKAVEEKFAPQGINVADSTLKNAYGNVLKHILGSPHTPQTVARLDPESITGSIDPSSLVALRRSVVNRFGYNPDNGNIEQKIANVARDILSQRAKDMTPGLAGADKAYQTRKLLQQNLPTIAKFAGIGSGLAGTGAAAAGIYGALNKGSNEP